MTDQPLRLMFQDEARFGLIGDPRRCWAPFPLRPLVKIEIVQQFSYAYAALSPHDGTLDSLILPHVDGSCMEIFLQELGRRHEKENILLVLDGAGWHHSRQVRIPDNIRLVFLPPYSPDLNPVEHFWEELREKYFHNVLFQSLSSLDDQLETGLRDYEQNPEKMVALTSWDWIKNIILNAK